MPQSNLGKQTKTAERFLHSEDSQSGSYFVLCQTGRLSSIYTAVPFFDRGNWVTSNHDKEVHRDSVSVFYSLI
jgi:hypothetical protein